MIDGATPRRRPGDPDGRIGGHAVLVTSRDPRSRVDHGRVSVLRTALASLAAAFDRVSVFHLRPEAGPVENLAPNASFAHLRSGRLTRLGHALRTSMVGHRALNEIAGIDRTQIAAMLDRVDPSGVDLFVLDGTRASASLPSLGSTPALVDLDDLLSIRYRAWAELPFSDLPFDIFGTNPDSRANTVARAMRPLLPTVLRREAKATEAMEREIAARATAVSLVSTHEAELFSARVGRPVEVLPMAAPSRPETPWSWPTNPRFDAVFLGRVTHLSNLAALNWFGREVVPELRDQLGRPPRVGIAGASTPEVDSWLGSLGLEPLGFVADLGELFARTPAAVAPQVAGGGLNTKVLDYAVHGVPVVGSAQAFSGMLRDGECPFATATDPVEFAEAVVRLGDDPDHARRLGHSGHQHVDVYYRPTAIQARWAAAFTTAIDSPGRNDG